MEEDQEEPVLKEEHKNQRLLKRRSTGHSASAGKSFGQIKQNESFSVRNQNTMEEAQSCYKFALMDLE